MFSTTKLRNMKDKYQFWMETWWDQPRNKEFRSTKADVRLPIYSALWTRQLKDKVLIRFKTGTETDTSSKKRIEWFIMPIEMI